MSSTVYQLALSMATSDTDKSDVYAALGMVAFKCQDLNGAKTALFTGYVEFPSFILPNDLTVRNLITS